MKPSGKSRTIIGSGKYLRLVKEGRFEFTERVNARGCAAVVAVTADRELVLTEQFRQAVGKSVIDLPAGLRGDVRGEEDEQAVRAALRELVEETGYTGHALTPLCECPSSPGLTSELVAYFYACPVKRVGAGGGVEHEQIQVHTPPLRTIRRWLDSRVASGCLVDPKVYVGLYFAGVMRRRQ